MSNGPDYTKYTEDQLFDAYTHIDKNLFPDRVDQIEQEFEKRSIPFYKRKEKANNNLFNIVQEAKENSKHTHLDTPENSKTKNIFKNGFFKTSLIVVLSILCIVNIFTVLYGALISIIPLLFQLIILFLILVDHPLQINLTKLWSIIILIGGIAGIVATTSSFILFKVFEDPNANMLHLSLSYIFFALIRIAFGLYIYMGAKQNVIESKNIN